MTKHGTLARACGVVLAAVLIAGCVARGEIQNHVGRINKSVGVSLNDAILLNIVRASRDEPLYFTSLPTISGQGTATLSTGLPTITIGPGQTASQQQFAVSNSLANETISTFDMGVLSSSAFYTGLLGQISLDEANLIAHQGYSRALLFSVLVDKIRITSGDNVEEIPNDPTKAETFRSFEQYLYLAVHYGLSVETQTGSDGKAISRLCFDLALAGTAEKPYVRRSPIQCGSPIRDTGAQLGFVINGQPQTIEIKLRSPNQIFRYLGSMVDAASAGRTVTLQGDLPGTTQGPLLTVTKDPLANCFARVKYGGQVYCVPNTGSENTKRIFQMVNQILALNTSTTDIPPTQNIYIRR